MDPFSLPGLLLLGFVMATGPDVTATGYGLALVPDQEVPIRRCRYSRIYSMLQATCTNLDLDKVPSDLQTDIQILDATVNRIRGLDNDSLSAYTSLTYLYLADNFILNIEESAFSRLKYLEVLDLNKNGCQDLPRSLFRLPYLRKLYLAENKLTDQVFETAVTSPIGYLQLSRNKLTRIPALGPQASLTHLNVSENSIVGVSIGDIAPFCSLVHLDLSRNPLIMDPSSCDCHIFKAWIEARKINVLPSFNCSFASLDQCSPLKFTNETLTLHQQCTDVIRIRKEAEQARSTWILVASCVSAFILCVFFALCFLHRRNKKRRRRLKEQQRVAATNANTELLNSNIPHDEHT